ncbi:MAG TPA: HEAT repeat domain-containing protein [Planctomycetota bacterium]
MLCALLLALALVPVPPNAAPRQEEEAVKVDERPEIKAKLTELAEFVKAKGEKDQEATGVIDTLLQEFPGSGPKDRAAIVKALGDCFDAKRKDKEEGVPDDGLYKAATAALGEMAPESVKVLIPLIGDKTHRKNQSLQVALTLALGKTKSPEASKTLLGLLKHKDPPMQAAGAEAMAFFADAPEALRKEMFEEMLKTMMDQYTKKETSPTDQEAQDRWNTISGPIIESLQKLSGHGESNPDQWLKWWNDNKKKPWSEKAG